MKRDYLWPLDHGSSSRLCRYQNRPKLCCPGAKEGFNWHKVINKGLNTGQDSMERLHEFDEYAYDAMRSMTGNRFSDESVSSIKTSNE